LIQIVAFLTPFGLFMNGLYKGKRLFYCKYWLTATASPYHADLRQSERRGFSSKI